MPFHNPDDLVPSGDMAGRPLPLCCGQLTGGARGSASWTTVFASRHAVRGSRPRQSAFRVACDAGVIP